MKTYFVIERPASDLEPMWRATVATYRDRILGRLASGPAHLSDLRRQCIGQMDSSMNHRIVGAVLKGIPANARDSIVVLARGPEE